MKDLSRISNLASSMSSEIRCTHCGTINVGSVARCRMCGHPLHHNEGEVRTCPECGSTATPLGTDRCIACGWNFGHREPGAVQEIVPPAAKECEAPAGEPIRTLTTFFVSLAVIFMIVAGGLGMIHGILAALPGTSNDILTAYEEAIPSGRFLDDIILDNAYISVLLVALGALSIGLSTMAMKRSSFAGALAGAVFGIFSIGFLFGAFFGLLALILLAVSRKEFLVECK